MKNVQTIMGIIWGNIYLFFKSFFCGRRIRYSFLSVISRTAKIVVRKKGRIRLGKKVFIRDYVEINSSGDLSIGSTCEIKRGTLLQANKGKLVIEDDVFINSGCLIVSCDEIIIDKGTMLGSNICIYDHDHVFTAKGHQDSSLQLISPVHIGKNCWIGSNTTILRGSCIGDNCLIGAGCIIRGDIPDGSKVIQRRTTEITPL